MSSTCKLTRLFFFFCSVVYCLEFARLKYELFQLDSYNSYILLPVSVLLDHHQQSRMQLQTGWEFESFEKNFQIPRFEKNVWSFALKKAGVALNMPNLQPLAGHAIWVHRRYLLSLGAYVHAALTALEHASKVLCHSVASKTWVR